MKHSIAFLFLFFCISLYISAQDKMGSISGNILDKQSKETLIGATVNIVGTYKSAQTDIEGNFSIKDLKPGDYSVKISYIGYSDKIINGIKITAGEDKVINTTVEEASNNLGEVVIEGEKNLIDLEQGKSSFKLTADDIKQTNMRDVQSLVAIQPGVNQTPDGIQIRGGRVYETAYIVDGISATDPLAGNGFGVGLSANSIQQLDVTTGNAGAEYGGAVSGVVASKIKDGGNKFAAGGSWTSDNVNKIWGGKAGWNTDFANFYIGSPIVKDKLSFFTSFDMQLSDDYTLYARGDQNLPQSTRFRANQLKSSLLDDPNNLSDFTNSKTWAPRQDNKWTHTLKIAYTIRKGMKITFTNQHSLNINQNTRSLLVQGFDAVMTPGFQYEFSRNLDHATTYTHRTNLTALNFKWLFAPGWSYDASVGRLFTNLRADANGRPFRPSTVDQVYDPQSIVTDPVTIFNPNDPIIFVNPGPGIVNNNGISRTWHDHYVEEYSVNQKLLRISKNNKNYFTLGWQHKEQELQWVDVSSPWVGAPVQLSNGTFTKSTSVGSSSDLWKANPATGGLYVTDEIRYKGIIATFGLRLSYWALGKYVDDAVLNPQSPLIQNIRDDYAKQTIQLDRRYQARLLPSIEVKFPVTDNNVLFFNYGQQVRTEHPLYYYQGLNPVYTNNSFLGNIGNPALRPSVTASYEIGLKSQITKNLAFTFTAFYKDYFDYAVNRTMTVKDVTGSDVVKQTYINQDYARVRGLEAVMSQRIAKAFSTTLSFTYQVATGKSNSANESRLQIVQDGYVGVNKERYLSWDSPVESKLTMVFMPDSLFKINSIVLKGFRFYTSSTFRSNQRRYTPYILTGTTDYGRPIYQESQTEINTQLSAPLFWTDLKISRDFAVYKKASFSVTLEFKNIFNIDNSQIINPVTGRAYEIGDPLPIDDRDPKYNYPLDNGVPPFNPARYMTPRQILLGISFNI